MVCILPSIYLSQTDLTGLFLLDCGHMGRLWEDTNEKIFLFLVEFSVLPIVLFPVCAVLYLSVCFPWLAKYTSI